MAGPPSTSTNSPRFVSLLRHTVPHLAGWKRNGDVLDSRNRGVLIYIPVNMESVFTKLASVVLELIEKEGAEEVVMLFLS